jgi:hypothetical protein
LFLVNRLAAASTVLRGISCLSIGRRRSFGHCVCSVGTFLRVNALDREESALLDKALSVEEAIGAVGSYLGGTTASRRQLTNMIQEDGALQFVELRCV